MEIYHNPRCNKSRQTLKIIQDAGKDVEIIEYLKTPPDHKKLKSLLKALGKKPIEIIRKGETIYEEQLKGKDLSDDELINAMVQYPILIERPIVVSGNKAALGRPPENVKSLL